ncbi:hypothetical protein FDP41_013036 [Naegleria fowleri]|uniref:Uncharacterized protein n=1 Tax=Naegleria fowleri TaxID=5763 RepID=A0A6A5C5Z2_NAEFO|nr:uncharacterized protein FDP41_013036 [Naegleria fowleri]KAF0981248.1 hypothetical protein FDP41_013036 [Naegleria fowleri]
MNPIPFDSIKDGEGCYIKTLACCMYYGKRTTRISEDKTVSDGFFALENIVFAIHKNGKYIQKGSGLRKPTQWDRRAIIELVPEESSTSSPSDTEQESKQQTPMANSPSPKENKPPSTDSPSQTNDLTGSLAETQQANGQPPNSAAKETVCEAKTESESDENDPESSQREPNSSDDIGFLMAKSEHDTLSKEIKDLELELDQKKRRLFELEEMAKQNLTCTHAAFLQIIRPMMRIYYNPEINDENDCCRKFGEFIGNPELLKPIIGKRNVNVHGKIFHSLTQNCLPAFEAERKKLLGYLESMEEGFKEFSLLCFKWDKQQIPLQEEPCSEQSARMEREPYQNPLQTSPSMDNNATSTGNSNTYPPQHVQCLQLQPSAQHAVHAFQPSVPTPMSTQHLRQMQTMQEFHPFAYPQQNYVTPFHAQSSPQSGFFPPGTTWLTSNPLSYPICSSIGAETGAYQQPEDHEDDDD